MVGPALGCKSDGFIEGCGEGKIVGNSVGFVEGAGEVGWMLGKADGDNVGSESGVELGKGIWIGDKDGGVDWGCVVVGPVTVAA